MAQHDYNIANDSFPTVRTDINNVLSAINSSNSGSSRPSSAVAGTIWLDTSGAATAQLLKMYDGAADILLGTVNFTANTIDWSDSTITVTDDSITLAKMASGTDGNIISYDASGNPVAVATGSAGQVLTSAGAGAVPTFATATVPDNSITLAKMASGTDGNIISYDASGNPVAIATGTDGQVLTSTGAGSPPAFETPDGGDVFRTLISTSTISTSTSTLTITGMDSTYSRYFVTITDLHSTNDNVHLDVQLVIGGAVKTGTNYEYGNYGRNSVDGASGVNVTNGNYWKISTQTIGFATGEAMMGEIVLYNPSGTTSFKSATWKTLLHDEEGDALTCSGGGSYKDGVAAATGIHFFFHIGNIASGVFKLWGSNE